MDDPLYPEAIKVARETGYVSISNLQRHMRIGFTRAARLMDRMVDEGFCEKEYNIYGHRKLMSDFHPITESAAEHHMHPTSGEAAVNGALSAPENQPSNVAESTPPTCG